MDVNKQLALLNDIAARQAPSAIEAAMIEALYEGVRWDATTNRFIEVPKNTAPLTDWTEHN